MVQAARDLLHLSDIEQKKSWEKDLKASLDSPFSSFQKDIHRLRGLSQETLMLQNLPVSKHMILKCILSYSEILLDPCLLFSQAPNKRPCQFKRFRRANKIAASMAWPWQSKWL